MQCDNLGETTANWPASSSSSSLDRFLILTATIRARCSIDLFRSDSLAESARRPDAASGHGSGASHRLKEMVVCGARLVLVRLVRMMLVL